MDLTANALAVLERRYLARAADGSQESPGDMIQRVAAAIAAADAGHGASPAEVAATAERFAARMTALEFLPNSPTLMNAGRPLGQLAACFVVPVEDRTEDIFAAVRLAAIIQKSGGGTGFSFSRLRPAGDLVASTGGTASGPVSFMQVFDVATEAVKQGGTRRGANMGILRVDHPDILEFIALKLDPGRMRNFNLSVAITDGFMRALEEGASYPLINPRTGAAERSLDAGRVWQLVCQAAWSTGDPGLVFLDRVNASQPTPALGAIEATNPCGEQPLLPFESCTLGSINLARFATSAPRPAVDWPRLRAAIRDGVHFLDNVIDVNRYPLPEIAAATRATRKIGLGVMGLADLFIALDLAYDEPRALALAGELARCLEEESLAASIALAERRGPFPAFAASRWAEPGSELAAMTGGRPIRNATTTTVAPTGTISILAGCSSGIEPLYAVVYKRRVLDGAVLPEVHAGFRALAEAGGFASEALWSELAERGRVRGLAGVPAELQRRFPTAYDVAPADHVAMQAAFQRHVHAAVSKTVNLPAAASPADIDEIYRLAYRLGCKGVTVYRDGSRAAQVLSTGIEAIAPGPAPCPECGAPLTVQIGCKLCHSCGYSVCG
jgi:ribonucleoside-diphosphate reductase alpha chain